MRVPVSARPALAALFIAGFLVRVVLINAEGFHNDIASFESWALTLANNPLTSFYAKASFADYPPGYFFVLWFVGHIYKASILADPGFGALKIAVKLPAIFSDLLDGALIYAIARRLTRPSWAQVAAAFFVLNPAVIFISAYWGQVDSVAAAFALAAVLAVLTAARERERAALGWLVLAWSLLACSVLMKPPAAMLGFMMLAFPFTAADRERKIRLIGTALGMLAALLLAFLAAHAFHPGNPVADLRWLYGRYAFGTTVYPYNSVNAFNLYTILHPFWQPDDARVGFGALSIAESTWGVVLLLGSAALIVTRYIQRKTSEAFVEGGALLALAFFVLSTRMHERYIFDALALLAPLLFAARRFRWAAAALSLSLLANLFYSLHYQAVVEQHIPGVNAADIIPLLTRPLSALNVLVFFALGYAYLSAKPEAAVEEQPSARGWAQLGWFKARSWFAPGQGLARMAAVDYAVCAAVTAVSFAVSYVNYWLPNGRIFDEIYYARSGMEYLGGLEQFEWTHPPLTKLVITLSIALFGGIHHGDNGFGWRFLNVVAGALTVAVLYIFAKRLTASTLFAAIAAGLLAFDGFHFVQSRIATPEITVAFFSLLTLYAFYRYWVAAQVRIAPVVGRRAGSYFAAGMVLVIFAAAVLAQTFFHGDSFAARVVAFVYFALGAYLLLRLFALPRLARRDAREVSYADGSELNLEGSQARFLTADGGLLDARTKQPAAGELTRAQRGGLVFDEGELRVEYRRDGTMRYATPEGTADFRPAGTMSVADATLNARHATLWLWLLALSAGALAASKWNGLFDLFVVWGIVIFVSAYRYGAFWRELGAKMARGLAVWGNPRGFPVDVVVTLMLFVGASIYVLTYIPYFRLHHSFGELVTLQKAMFHYHDTLVATHPYASRWWQWPLLLKPIAYFYHDYRMGAATTNSGACCVAEILALPNPLVWWSGLLSVPWVALLGWKERNKGYLLLIVAYLVQWLPWISSPRVTFEYHFYPNLAIICLCNAVVLQRIWQGAVVPGRVPARLAVGAYLAATVALFVYFYPVLAGTQIPWDAWHARMWLERWVI